MEMAIIDWKNVESRFVRDEMYENINAPRWADLSDPDPPVDDVGWFCRPDCGHFNTSEKISSSSPASNKARSKRSMSSSEVVVLGERKSNLRDSNLKKREGLAPLSLSFVSSAPLRQSPMRKPTPKKYREDLENQNPNLPPSNVASATPLRPKIASKTFKEALDSSTENREGEGFDLKTKNPTPPQQHMKSTLSARNVFSGKDILSQIFEFCQEIKKLVGMKEKHCLSHNDINEDEKIASNSMMMEDLGKEEQGEETTKQEKKSKKPVDDNKLPLLKEMALSCPQTPQRFSASPSLSHPPKCFKASRSATASPLNKPLKSSTPERGILRDLVEKSDNEKKPLVSMDEERTSLDVFWFLKPCTYLANQ